MIGGDKSAAGISSFQALSVSLSGRIGTGNIAGVATAIFIGGPGAVFWMWLVAFLGSGSAFVESTLGQSSKERKRSVQRWSRFLYQKDLKIKHSGNGMPLCLQYQPY